MRSDVAVLAVALRRSTFASCEVATAVTRVSEGPAEEPDTVAPSALTLPIAPADARATESMAIEPRLTIRAARARHMVLAEADMT